MKVSWILITDLGYVRGPCCAACTLDEEHVRWYRCPGPEGGVWGPRFRVWVLQSHRFRGKTIVFGREGVVGVYASRFASLVGSPSK